MNDMNGIIPIHYGYCISQARPYGVFNTALSYYIDLNVTLMFTVNMLMEYQEDHC